MLDHERYMALDKDLREEDFRKGVFMSVSAYVCMHCVHECVYLLFSYHRGRREEIV